MNILVGILVALSALLFIGYVCYLGQYIKAIENKLIETINKVNELDTKSIYYEKAYEQMKAQRDKFIKRVCDLQIKNYESNDSKTNL